MTPRKEPSSARITEQEGQRLYGAFSRVKAYVMHKSGGHRAAHVALRICPDIRKGLSGAARRRAFMHTGHAKNYICTNIDASKLPDGHLFGILFHEFGHIFAGAGEGKADQWAFERFGIPILYKGAWKLEWVDPELLAQKSI